MNDIKNDTSDDHKRARALLEEVHVQCLADTLQSAPPPPRKLTQREALVQLIPALKSSLKRGHTVDSLAAVLQAQGVEVSARTLRQLLNTAGEARSNRPRPTG